MFQKSTKAAIVAILLVCLVAVSLHLAYDREYFYSGSNPPGPKSIAMSIGPQDGKYLIWNIVQTMSSGHNMQGVWCGKINDDFELEWSRRISEDYGHYPVVAVDSSGIIYTVWLDKQDNGAVLDSSGQELRKLRIPTPDDLARPPVLNIDQWGNLHLRYSEDSSVEEALILDDEGYVIDVVDPTSMNYTTTYELNKNSTSRVYEGSVIFEGRRAVYVVDDDSHIWIASVNSEAFITIVDQDGVLLVDGQQVDVIPESVPLALKYLLVVAPVIISVAIIIGWALWLKRSRKLE